jgi:outer membrane receptor protein involved in Fe transport
VLAALHAPGVLAQQRPAGAPRSIEEITVTATRREMNIQDVPQSISAFSTADIEKQAFEAMEDYVRSLASTNLVNSMPGRNTLIMRGVTTSAFDYRTDSQVSVYLDDQPITSASQQPDVRMIDIQRIESLPGPQGTLFGSSSQAGTLHIITNKPSPDALSGQLDSEVASTKGGEMSYDLSGHINVPVVEDKLAIRMVGYYSHEGGYVDNVLGPDLAPATDTTNADVVEEDQNDYDTYGGRFNVLWNMTEKWTGEVSLITQWSDADGSWESDPAIGEYKLTRFYDEWRDDDWWQAAVTANGDLGFATLTTAVSYFDREMDYEWDNTLYEQWKTAYYGVYYPLYDTDYTYGFIFNDQHQDRYSAEVRLTSQGESRLSWIAGAFYEKVYDWWFYGAKNPSLMSTTAWDAALYYAAYYSAYYPYVQSPLEPTTIGYSNLMERTIKQSAVFGELTYDLTEKFSVTGGARWFEFDRDQFDQYQVPQGLPPAGGYDTNGVYTSEGKQGDTALKLGARYSFDDDRMLYFVYSEGFRLGGSNSPRAVNAGVGIPSEYGPDTMQNYELGFKSLWFDSRFEFNVDLSLMQWDDIQIYARNDESPWWVSGIFNGNTAEQTGIELAMSWQATDRLKLDASAFFADPEFTEDTFLPRDDPDDPTIRDGETMPNSPERKYWWAAEYTVPGAFGLEGNLWFRYDSSYQSSTYNTITNAL